MNADSIPAKRRKLLSFLVTGMFNTAFGYGIFAALNYFLSAFRFGYLAAAVLGNIIAITFSYVNYKLFVFKTPGNAMREYLRFYLVYGASLAVSFVCLLFLVEGLKLNSYLAAALLLPVSVVMSYVGHNRFSFRRKSLEQAE